MAKLPHDLTIAEFNARYNHAFSRQSTWRNLLSDTYEFFVPQQNIWRFDNLSPGDQRDSRIFDGVPEVAMNEGANKVKSVITPDWREWAQLSVADGMPEEIRESAEVTEQLQDITGLIFSQINQSNFSIQIGEAYKDWLIGTGAIEVRENIDPLMPILSYHVQNQQFIAYEAGPFGNIENEYKAREVPARNVERSYPGGDFSQSVREAIKDKPNSEIKFREGYLRFPDGYYLIVLEQGTDQVVWAEHQGLHNPIAVFRYAVMADEIRGRGPAISALPDARTLNKIQEFALQKSALDLAGMYTSVDDGTFNANTMVISPGVIIPVSNNGRDNPTLQRLDTGTDLNLTLFEVDRITQNIRKTLFNDLRQPDGPVRSATEIAIETQELAARIGSAFGRIQTEGLIPILNRTMDILKRRGVIPDIRIDGQQIDVKFTSPLARAQDQEDLISLQSSIALSMELAGEEMTALGYDMEKLPGYIGRKTGVAAELLRDEGERESAKQEMIQAAQSAAQVVAEQEALPVQ